MRFIIISLSLILFLSIKGVSQDYSTAAGFRGGLFAGVTVKHFVGKNIAVEGILSSRWSGFDITGLYEIHQPAFDVDGLKWYYGGGGHIGFWDESNVRWRSKTNSYTVIGLDGVLGLEYVFKDLPLNISVDWKPMLNIIGYFGFWGDNGAVSVRYIF